MSYEQPDPETTESAPAAAPAIQTDPLGTLARLLSDYTSLLHPQDAETVEAALPAFLRPQYDAAVQLGAMISEDRDGMAKRARFQQEFARRDQDEELATAYEVHRRAKLADSGHSEKLAAEFAEGCYDSASLDEIEIPDPLIEGFMDKSSLVRLFGPSNSYKSFVGIDLAGCISAGIEWHGNATTKGRTLYVAAEGAPGSVKRIRAWEKQYGMMWQGVLYKRAVQIADDKAMAAMIAYATLGNFEFVVFDTQARCTVGMEENDNTAMGRVVASLDVLKEATGACVMMVHHSGSESADRGRGATAIYAAMDSEFRVTRKGGGMNITFETMKRKDGEQAQPLALTAVEHTVTTHRGQETSLAVASGHVSAYETTGVRQVTPELSTGQKATLVALSRYGAVGSGPTALAVDQGMTKDKKNVVAQNLAALVRLTLAKKSNAKYEITDLGYTALENEGLNTGYHTVESMDDDDE